MTSQLYGCLACGVQSIFDADEQKDHYKSEWHRYNLRRKINGLPFISLKAFEEKLAAASGAAVKEISQTLYCSACRKGFGSKNSYENHVKSLKHLQMVNVTTSSRIQNDESNTDEQVESDYLSNPLADFVEESSDMESNASWETLSDEDVTEDELETWTPNCFLCHWPKHRPVLGQEAPKNKKPPRITALLKHLAREHSFVLPQPECISDLKSLLCHLSCRVVIHCQCLWCGTFFASSRAAQQHMKDKGHTQLRHELSKLIATEKSSKNNRNRALDSSMDVDDDFDKCNSFELLRHLKYYDFKNFFPSEPVSDDDGWSLLLPNGTLAGHRDLHRYYKQHLRAVPQGFHCPANLARLGFASSEEKRRTVLSVVTQHQQSKQLLMQVAGARAYRLTPVTKADQRHQQHLHSRRHLRLAVNQNNLMDRFRSQLGIGGG